MLAWLAWLLSTAEFHAPTTGGGWSPALVAVHLAASFLLWLVSTTIALLLLLFRCRKTETVFFRSSALALWFAAFIFLGGQTHLASALAFFWPAYRLFTLVRFLAAGLSWATLTIMIPIALERERQRLRDERHDFANKVNVVSLRGELREHKLAGLVAQMEGQEQQMAGAVAALSDLIHQLQPAPPPPPEAP